MEAPRQRLLPEPPLDDRLPEQVTDLLAEARDAAIRLAGPDQPHQAIASMEEYPQERHKQGVEEHMRRNIPVQLTRGDHTPHPDRFPW